VALLPTGAIRSKCLPAVINVADEIQNDPERMTKHLVSALKCAPNVMQLLQPKFLAPVMFLILN
jgi:hypothetical protein